MDDNFSPRVKDVIAYSKEEALRLGHDFIGTEHLMLGLLRDGNGKAISILDAMDAGINVRRLQRTAGTVPLAVIPDFDNVIKAKQEQADRKSVV